MAQRAFKSFLTAVLLLVTLGISGCDFFTGSVEDKYEDRINQRIENRRQQWEDQDLEDYRLTYSQQVAETIVDTVRVFVRQGAVDSIYASRDISEEALLVGTVDSFFELIKDRVGEDESEFSVDFHQEQGYPTSYTADFTDGRSSQTVLTRRVEPLTEP